MLIGIIILLIVMIIFIVVRTILITCIKPRRNQNQNEKHELENRRIPFLEQLEIDTERIRFVELLGEGCFGSVWKAVVSHSSEEDNLQIVGVKMLKGNFV